MEITYKDICIRNAGPADCEQLAAWWNDGAVMAHAGFPNGLGTTPEHIREEIAGDTDDTDRRLIIDYKGVPIGEMSYGNKGGNVAEIGIKICNPDYQEKGLGRTILSMLIAELFARGYTKIVLDTNLKNERAQHGDPADPGRMRSFRHISFPPFPKARFAPSPSRGRSLAGSDVVFG